jgi:hypothetical protein
MAEESSSSVHRPLVNPYVGTFIRLTVIEENGERIVFFVRASDIAELSEVEVDIGDDDADPVFVMGTLVTLERNGTPFTYECVEPITHFLGHPSFHATMAFE